MNNFEDPYGILLLNGMKGLTEEFDEFDLIDENPLMRRCSETFLFGMISQCPFTRKILKISLVD